VTIDAAIADAVRAAVAPVLTELATLREQVAILVQSSPPQMLSVAEAAKRMGTCAATIRRMCASGELAHRRCGRRVLVDSAALRPTDSATVARLSREARS
jgi:excisionase family DNA binding protein